MNTNILAITRSVSIILACATCLFAANAASAQSTGNSDWNASIGALVLTAPAYPGAKNEHANVYPFGDVVYKNEFFFRSDSIPGASIRGLGAYLVKRDGVEITASLAPSFEERDARDDQHFRNLGNVSPTLRAALAASYQHDWWKISSAITRDLSEEKKEGVTGGVDFTGTYHYSSDLSFHAGPGVTYGNAQYMKTFYGITPAQSQASGLAVYNTTGGVGNVHFSTGVNYRIGRTWNVGGFATEARLGSDAGNSPVVETKNQSSVGIYLVHQM